ncbi:MAG: hypothetical protein ABH969_11515 [Pseudomonadota bacterium]
MGIPQGANHQHPKGKRLIHLLIETPDGNIALGMQQLNGVYILRP